MQEKNNRVIHLRYSRGIVEGWSRRGGGGGGGGVVAVLHHILWIAACSGLMGCGGSKCCPIMSSCLLLVCRAYCPTISSVIKLDLGSFDRSYAMASIKHVR